MAKTWVLETHTKGTGANIVPLDPEQEQDQPAPERERDVVFVHPPTRPRPPKPPEPRNPRRFKVVEVTTHRVLAEDAGARATLEALRDVDSVVDVAVSVWDDKHERYRLLTHGEQRTLWEMRGALDAPAGAGRQAASGQP
jgi:hypothetical protein